MQDEFIIKGFAEKSRDITADMLTSWYNFSVSHFLFKKRIFCWSIPSTYYSIMHATRGLIKLLIFERSDMTAYADTREYIRSHAAIPNLLQKGNGAKIQQWWQLTNFFGLIDIFEKHNFVSKQYNDNLKYTYDIGTMLRCFKAFRVTSSYDTYFILAQDWGRITLGPKISDKIEKFKIELGFLSRKMLEENYRYLLFISDLFAKFLTIPRTNTENELFSILIELVLGLVTEVKKLLNTEGLYSKKTETLVKRFIHSTNNDRTEIASLSEISRQLIEQYQQ